MNHTIKSRSSGRIHAGKMNEREHGFTLVELLVVMTIIGMLMSMLLPAVMSARGAARRLQCMNNLHNVSLALLSDVSAKGRFPASGAMDKEGTRYYYGWVVTLLPRLERQDIADAWNKDLPYDAAVNAKLASLSLNILVCPDDFSAVPGEGNLSYVVNGGFGWTSARRAKGFVAGFHATSKPALQPFDLNGNGIVCPSRRGEDGKPSDMDLYYETSLFFLDSGPGSPGRGQYHTPDTVVDGLSNTLMLSENVRAGYDGRGANWASPHPAINAFHLSSYVCRDVRCCEGNVDYGRANDRAHEPQRLEAINAALYQAEGEAPWPSSGHPGGVFVAFCDGRIQFMSEDIAGGVYASLVSPRGTLISGPLGQPLPDADDYLR